MTFRLPPLPHERQLLASDSTVDQAAGAQLVFDRRAKELFCVNCRHCDEKWECQRPRTGIRDPVTGKIRHSLPRSCQYERENKYYKWSEVYTEPLCGPSALFFEPKDDEVELKKAGKVWAMTRKIADLYGDAT